MAPLDTGAGGLAPRPFFFPPTLSEQGPARFHAVPVVAAIVVLSLALPHQTDTDWLPALLALAGLSVVWALFLVPAFRPVAVYLRLSAAAAAVLVLVTTTGGTLSPYRTLYVPLLLYVAIVYQRRALVLATAGIVALAAAPYVVSSAPDLDVKRADFLITVAVWLLVSVFAHRLVVERRKVTVRLRDQEQRYRSLFDLNPHAAYALDVDGRVTSANHAGRALLGQPAQEIVGTELADFLGEDGVAALDRCLSTLSDQHAGTFDTTVTDHNGLDIDVSFSCVPIVVGGKVIGAYGIAKDISEAKARQDRLAQQALHDPLTGLANRTLLTDRLEHAVGSAGRSGEPLCVLLIDLDGFKQVNDELGHAAGDAVLVTASARLRRCVRPGDTLARLGGDEFVIVLPGAQAHVAVTVARRVLAELAQPVSVGGERATVQASVGIAVAEPTGCSVERILERADLAMYAAKQNGRGRFEIFGPDLELSTDERRISVSTADARAWADYVTALRTDISGRKQAGRLAGTTRAPASVHRTLLQVLSAIENLPADPAVTGLDLPPGDAVEEFVFHQTAVQHWADTLVREGVLTTGRPCGADRFWNSLTTEVADARRRQPAAG